MGFIGSPRNIILRGTIFLLGWIVITPNVTRLAAPRRVAGLSFFQLLTAKGLRWAWMPPSEQKLAIGCLSSTGQCIWASILELASEPRVSGGFLDQF